MRCSAAPARFRVHVCAELAVAHPPSAGQRCCLLMDTLTPSCERTSCAASLPGAGPPAAAWGARRETALAAPPSGRAPSSSSSASCRRRAPQVHVKRTPWTEAPLLPNHHLKALKALTSAHSGGS